MRKWWQLLIGLIGIFGGLIAWGLAARWGWGLSLSGVLGFSKVWPELIALLLHCAATALIPALLCGLTMALIYRRQKPPSGNAMALWAVGCLALGIWGGVLPLWRMDQIQMLCRREWEEQGGLERGKLDGLRKEGRYEEMVQEMERVLALHEEVMAKAGPRYERPCNLGFSYLWVYLHPASDDLPQHLGFGLTYCLFDAWHDEDYGKSAADGLSKAMTRSKHPLLRALAYWVEQDYPAFEREALAGAAAGDRRMDALALVAACAISEDKKAALEIVRPILDRGVGLGATGCLPLSSSEIRAYLDGGGPAPDRASIKLPGRTGKGMGPSSTS